MKIVHWKNEPIRETPHKVDVRALYDKTDAEVRHITLQPGEQLKPHITPVDVFFFILEGTPSVRVGDETIQVEENSLVESPKGIIHSLLNKSDKLARILVVKTPKPTTTKSVL